VSTLSKRIIITISKTSTLGLAFYIVCAIFVIAFNIFLCTYLINHPMPKI
jgi:hypothetical protein